MEISTEQVVEATSGETELTQSADGGNEAVAAPTTEAPQPAETPAEETEKVGYSQHLQKLMERTRVQRQEKVAEKEQQELLDTARLIQAAKKQGDPSLALRALGIREDQPKSDPLDRLKFEDLLGERQKNPLESELDVVKKELEELKNFKTESQKELETAQKRQQVEQRNAWMRNQHQQMASAIEESASELQYLNATKELGTVGHTTNLMLSLYQQGYQPGYKDVAESYEKYIDDLLDALSTTDKFKQRFGAPEAPSFSGDSLTNNMGADGTSTPDLNAMSDEENRAYAMANARAIWEANKKQKPE